MDMLLLGKGRPYKSYKMAEPDFGHWIVPVIISGQDKMVCLLVGVKEKTKLQKIQDFDLDQKDSFTLWG